MKTCEIIISIAKQSSFFFSGVDFATYINPCFKRNKKAEFQPWYMNPNQYNILVS